MLTIWWGTHKDNIVDWKKYRRMMRLRFGSATTQLNEKYTHNNDMLEHLD